MLRETSSIIAAVLLAAQPQVVLSVVPDQVDDFEDGTVMGWFEDSGSPNPPVNISDGGPSGDGDNYLENAADGNGPGCCMHMSNIAQWSGDYVAEGVTWIGADIRAVGEFTLAMRIAIEGSNGGRYGSKSHEHIPKDGKWHRVYFGLTAADLGWAGGEAPLEDVLADVVELRILSSGGCCPVGGPSWEGDAVNNTFAVDNIHAGQGSIPEAPVPAVSEWGLGLMALLLATAGSVVIRRQRRLV